MSASAHEVADARTGVSSGRDTPGRLRRDRRFLKLYALTVPRTLKYSSPQDDAGEVSARECVARIEDGLAAESVRYRMCGWAIVALLVALPLLAAFLWSGMTWVPVRVYWWPFERGNYGLPFLSLFEWLSYLLLAAYFVVTWALLRDGYSQTRRLGAEYRRLLAADATTRLAILGVLREGASPRAEFLVRRAPAFATYRQALYPDERP